METTALETNIERAIERLLPLFKVTPEERARFQKPGLRRHLYGEYLDWPDAVPAYSFVDNWFYFPERDTLTGSRTFCAAAIHHLAGFYVLAQLNPEVVKGAHSWLSTGKLPPGHEEWRQLAGEYGNLILKLRYPEPDRYEHLYENVRRVYERFGAAFLPQLARMRLADLEKLGILEDESN